MYSAFWLSTLTDALHAPTIDHHSYERRFGPRWNYRPAELWPRLSTSQQRPCLVPFTVTFSPPTHPILEPTEMWHSTSSSLAHAPLAGTSTFATLALRRHSFSHAMTFAQKAEQRKAKRRESRNKYRIIDTRRRLAFEQSSNQLRTASRRELENTLRPHDDIPIGVIQSKRKLVVTPPQEEDAMKVRYSTRR